MFLKLSNIFKIKDLGRPARILGIELTYFPDGLLLHQSEYAAKISEWCMQESKVPIQCKLEVLQCEVQLNKEDHELYRKLVGSLLYLVVSTRPDLAYVSSVLGKHVSRPTRSCLDAARRTMEYVKGTSTVGLWYGAQDGWNLQGFTDTDHCSESDRMSRYCYILRMGEHTVAWTSKSLPDRSLSSTESELYGANYCGMELLYLGKMQAELLLSRALEADDIPIVPLMLIDNASTVKLLCSRDYKHATRHIEIRNLWVIYKCQEHKLIGQWISGELNISDQGTKPLARVRLYTLMHNTGMRRLITGVLEGNAQSQRISNLSESALVMTSLKRMRETLSGASIVVGNHATGSANS